MSGLVIAYAHWKTNAVGSRYPPCTCRFSNGTTLCLHSGAAHLFRLFFALFSGFGQQSCSHVVRNETWGKHTYCNYMQRKR